MSDKKLNSKEILESIEALPICKESKDGVTKLIKSLGFEIEKEKKREPQRGEVWEFFGSARFIVEVSGTGQNSLRAVDLQGSQTLSDVKNSYAVKEDYEFVASSLAEYFEKN